MLKELYTAAMGMLPQQTRMEVIANNMANASTAGFKRSSVFERNLIDAKCNFYNVQGDAEQNDPPVGQYTDFSQGSYEQTDNPLDVAIESQNGFFLVEDQDGNSFLTRSGNFKLSEEGYIVTYEGKKLIGNNQTPIRISEDFHDSQLTGDAAKNLNLVVNNNGEISINEKPAGSIQIVNVKNLESLQQISNSDFVIRTNSDLEYLTPETTAVRQGWIEKSNVSVVDEMVAMIELQRMFEVGSKVIQTNDSTLDQSIRLGRYQ